MVTPMITEREPLVGQPIRRREDPRLITGTATYVDHIQMPGMHHACIVRSPGDEPDQHAAQDVGAGCD
jgi:CO/xanthine dehydrogenase Mo-binding subunit